MLVALEGIDGSGKRTQAELLRQTAQNRGLKVGFLSFPRYNQTFFAKSVQDYLNAKFGDLHSTSPYFAGLLYAGDRFESRNVLSELLATCDLVVLDRYTGSNLAHQASRLSGAEREEIMTWLNHLEHQVFGLPVADITVYLDVPVSTAARHIADRNERVGAVNSSDIHENSRGYLIKCREVYLELAARSYGSTWRKIECVTADGAMLPEKQIAALVWDEISARLDSHMPATDRAKPLT